MKVHSVFSGYSVNDQAIAKDFYTNTLGLELESEDMGLRFILPGGGSVFIYAKDEHQAATFTVLNLVVADIDEAVKELTGKGVQFEMYDNLFDGANQEPSGIMRSPDAAKYGPSIAWFKDPAGNTLSVIQG
ncbi:MAG: glyoxalase [Candidatus Saccharibacteria bacterium]|nr:glyoxalase [Candidatus Saccharibacteria bacterium]